MHQINVFISHSWTYSGHYEKLAEWIFEDQWKVNGTPIIFGNVSVPKDDPIHGARNTQELAARILEGVRASDIVVCPTGMYSNYSKWIEPELAGAQALRRPILAVNPWGQERKSSVVQSRASRSVGWNKRRCCTTPWLVLV